MVRMMSEKVLIYRCQDYDPVRIKALISQGMEELEITPRGKTLIKPNIVIAHRTYFPHAFTRPEFVDGLIGAVKDRGAEIKELAVGERCGITIPTRFAFSQAGYNPMLRRHRVKRYCFDECFQVERRLYREERLRDYLFVPQPIDECDFLISAPKLKSHPWTRITVALKNFIGIQDDRHRLIDHDVLLEHKIADLQEVIQPGLIAVDAIAAGELKMLTPLPYPLHAIIMGTNQVAVDALVCQIIGFDPRRVEHLRICHERGYGPLDPAELEVGGDFPLDEIQEKAKDFRVPTTRVDEELNPKSNIKAYVGSFPEPDKVSYCWGGCPGALIEGLEIVKTMQPGVYREVRPLHYVFGNYQGEIDAKPGERVILCGDCAQYQGTIAGRPVDRRSRYVSRRHKDPRRAASKGLIIEIILFLIGLFRSRKEQVLRARGCPVSVAENVLFLWRPGGTKNPYLDPRIVAPFTYHYLRAKLSNMVRILFGRRPRALKKGSGDGH